jgi:hypothetical protein
MAKSFSLKVYLDVGILGAKQEDILEVIYDPEEEAASAAFECWLCNFDSGWSIDY